MEKVFVLNFLTEYKLWILAGTPEDYKYPFNKECGLCSNFSAYARDQLRGEKIGEPFDYAYYDQIDKAKTYFKSLLPFANCGDTRQDYPFNSGVYEYDHESNLQIHHLNKNRIEWINKMLEGENV